MCHRRVEQVQILPTALSVKYTSAELKQHFLGQIGLIRAQRDV